MIKLLIYYLSALNILLFSLSLNYAEQDNKKGSNSLKV